MFVISIMRKKWNFCLATLIWSKYMPKPVLKVCKNVMLPFTNSALRVLIIFKYVIVYHCSMFYDSFHFMFSKKSSAYDMCHGQDCRCRGHTVWTLVSAICPLHRCATFAGAYLMWTCTYLIISIRNCIQCYREYFMFVICNLLYLWQSLIKM